MKDFLLGKEGLDQVLLRLAERWDTLDVSTQRYIATQAAGSRQQSRFLALLADYSRTQELVSAAYNSAGSANEQFEKTLDSLEAKLNKLSNAWNEFTMGIAQNGLIKVAVDGLTGLLTIINKITGVFGPTTGAILKMGLAFVALRAGAKLLPNLFKAIATTIVMNGDKAGQGFGQRIVNALAEKTPEVYARGYTMGQAARQGFEDGAKGNAPAGAGDSSIGSSVPLLSSGKENPTGNLKASPDNFKKQYTASAVMTGVGMGINFLTNAVRENADELSAAQDEALSYFETLGNGLTIVGAGTAILTHFGVTLTGIGASLGVIGIAAAALYGAFKIASYFSYEKQLERATEAYQKAAQAYSDVISNKSAYQTQIEELNGLTRGTDEWNQKLLEVQETVASLRELGYEVSYQNGVPTIDFSSETNQRVIKEKEQASKQAQLEMVGDQLQSTLSDWLVLANTPVTTRLPLTEDQKQEKTQLENQGLNQLRQLMNLLPDEASDFAQQYEFFGKTIGDYTKADNDKLQKLLENEDDFTNFITGLKEYSGIDSETAGRLVSIIKVLASGVKDAWNQVPLVNNTFAEFADAGLTQAQIQRANQKVASARQISDDLENTVKTAYDDVVQNFSGEERDTLLLYLDNLDFSDPNLITNLESDFERLGVVAGSTTASALLALANAASAAGVAISKYNFAENKKQALSTRKIAKDIEENDTKEFDADTFAQIKAALNGTVEGDKLLAQMVEGQDGSYSFIGKRSELSTALYNSADESAAKGLEAVKFQAVAQKKLNYNQLDSIGVKNVADWSKYIDESEDNLGELFTKFIPETLSTQEKNALFGVSNFGKVDWNGTQGQELLSKLGEYLLDPEFYSRQVTEAQTDFSPYGIDNTPQRILNASAGNQGSEEEANKYLQKQVQDSESGEAVLATWGETADKAANSILALATGTSDGIEKFEDFTKVVSDNKDALKAENKGLTKYSKALSETHKAAQKVFGDNLTEDFVEENLDLFKKMAEGDQDALLQIQHAIRDQALSEYATDEESQKQIDNIKAGLETLENSDVEIGAVLDGTQVFTALAAIMGGAEKAAAFLDSMGWTAVYTYGPDGTIATAQLVRTANAAAKSTASGGGGGGGGGGGDKKDVWDNPYDILYNLTEKINEALRDREKLEKTYDRLLEDRNASFSDLIKNTLSTIANLEKEINLQTRLQQGRREQIEKIGRETYRNSDGIEKRYEDLGVMDYAHYDFDTQTITIDWEGLEQITDTEKGQAVEDYIGRLEELVEQYEETQDTLSDMEDELREIKERGKSEYLDFEQKVYDAIVARQQLLIDDFSDLASTISDTNSKILDDLSRSIELQRQIRDNTKTEQDLQDKEARLAYLQRDTSGANQTEILQLQKELEEARQNYQDTLIDQELDRLNEVNDVANDQRERQIEIMQAQLDWAAKNGEFWEETYTLIQGAFNEDGTFNNNSALVELLKGTDAFKGMSEFGQMNWIAELIKEYNQAQLGFSDWMVDRESKEGNTLQTNAGELTYTNGKWQDANGGVYALSYDPKTKSWIAQKADTSEGRPEIKDKVVSNDSGSSGSGGGGGGSDSNPNDSGSYWTQYRGSANGPVAVGRNKAPNAQIARKLEQQSYQQALLDSEAIRKSRGGRKLEGDKSNMKFASGGLTSKTGPAWLDGTLSRPEYVLNPIQTEAFLKLTKVLPSLLSGDVSTKTMMGGDNYYDVNFVVDSIGSDYDVDKLWNRFKEKIYEDSAYRNVHTINRLR